MINTREIHKLKDILIDHIFDHCFNEVVQKVESPGLNLTLDDPSQLQDPDIKPLWRVRKNQEVIRDIMGQGRKNIAKY